MNLIQNIPVKILSEVHRKKMGGSGSYKICFDFPAKVLLEVYKRGGVLIEKVTYY